MLLGQGLKGLDRFLGPTFTQGKGQLDEDQRFVVLGHGDDLIEHLGGAVKPWLTQAQGVYSDPEVGVAQSGEESRR